jgi:DNA end-binding protein Ku
VAPRASWKGYLKLSLVSCAVALYPAQTSTERISFNQLNRATGNRLKQQMIDTETGEVVERENRARGYEVDRGEYLIIEDAELEALQIESTRTLEIERFVPQAEVDPVYRNGSHYLAQLSQLAGFKGPERPQTNGSRQKVFTTGRVRRRGRSGGRR